MTEPENPENKPAHESLFGKAAAETAPGPVLDHEPVTTPPPPPPPASAPPGKTVVRRGGTPLLLTLLIAAGLAGGGYWAWLNPMPHTIEGTGPSAADPASGLAAKVQDLSDRVDKLEKAPPSQTAAAPQPAADADTPAKLQALSDRIDKLEKAPAPEAAASAPAASDATVDLSKKLDDLTAQMNGISSRQDQLAAGLSKVQETAAQKTPDIATPQPDHAAQEIANAAALQAQQQVADLGGKTNYALTQQKSTLDTLEQRLGKLEQAEQTDQSTAAAQSSAQISALDSRVGKLEQSEGHLEQSEGHLEQSEGQLQGATKDAALAVKLQAAQAALSAGKPLGDLPGAPPALQRFATSAPPTEPALRAQFNDVSAAILAASRPEEAHTTFFSRALARVEQSVTVRQGDHVIVGDPAAGVVARAQAALNGGDLAGAVNALDGLTGRAADAAKSWRAQAEALVAARAALLSMAVHG